jgi:hypothetical protein
MAVTEGLGGAAPGAHVRDRVDTAKNKTCRLFGAARGDHSMHAAITVKEPRRRGKTGFKAYMTEDVDE